MHNLYAMMYIIILRQYGANGGINYGKINIHDLWWLTAINYYRLASIIKVQSHEILFRMSDRRRGRPKH